MPCTDGTRSPSPAESPSWGISALAEREHVGLGAGLQERDLKRPLADHVVLAYELVQAAAAEEAVAILVDVLAVRAARRLAVDEHAEGDRLSRRVIEHEVRVASVEAVGDAPAGLFEDGVLAPDRPLAGQRPVVELQAFG